MSERMAETREFQMISDGEVDIDEMKLPSDAARKRRWRRAQFSSKVVGPKVRTIMPTDVVGVAYDIGQFIGRELGYRVKPGEVLAALVPDPFRAAALSRMRGVERMRVEAIVEVVPKVLEEWKLWETRAKVAPARGMVGGGT